MSGIIRRVIVDTMGLPHAIAVTAANVSDRDGSIQMLLLWDVVTIDIPDLKQFCDEQLSALEHSEEP